MDEDFPSIAAVGRPTRKRQRVEDESSGAPPVPPTAPAGGGSKKKSGGFQGMGLSKDVLGGVLRLGYRAPTPIQRKAIPAALAGRDLVAMARTGSGKTASFLVPLLERLRAHVGRGGARAIVLSPTRELALQTLKFAKSLGKFTDLRFASIVGGESMGGQFAALADHPDAIIATPGRLMHLLREVPGFHLRAAEFLVFDEADRLFEMGFAEQLRDLLAAVPEQRQTLLFSATLPKVLIAFAKAGLKDPQLLRLDVDTKVSENLRLAFLTTRREEKPAALLWLLRSFLPVDQQALVFVATRHHAEFVVALLSSVDNLPALAVYGSQDMETRTSNLERFRLRRARVLVVTDLAARGLDIPLLDNVINYDFPDIAKLFVHRVGRVARQGRTGVAFSLVTNSDLPYMLDVLLLLGRPAENVFLGREAGRTGGGAGDAVVFDEGADGAGSWGGGGVVAGRGGADSDEDEGSAEEGVGEKGGYDSGDSGSAVGGGARSSVGGGARSLSGRSLGAGSQPRGVAARAATASVGGGTAITNAVRFDEGEGYTLEEMTPSDVHYGQLPRGPLEAEAEVVRVLCERHIELRKLAKSADNALQLYNKTRAEASRRSAARARTLPDDRPHPLLLSFQGKGEVALSAYVAGLQSFRPRQTILELESGASRGTKGAGDKRGDLATGKGKRTSLERGSALMAAKRKLHGHAVAPRVGSVSLGAAALAAAQGSSVLADDMIGSSLAAELAGVGASMGDTVGEMVAAHKARAAARVRRAAAAAAAAAGAQDGEGGGDDGGEQEEGQGGHDDDDGGMSFASAPIDMSGGGPLLMCGKQRVSKALRKRLAGGGSGLSSTRPLAQHAAAAMAAAAAAHDDDIMASDRKARGVLTKSERRRLLRDAGVGAAASAFKDAEHFVTMQPAEDAVAEAAYSSAGTLSRNDGTLGLGGSTGRGSGDMSDLVRLEDGALDLAPDETNGLHAASVARGGPGGKVRKVRFWDAAKKKYLLVRPEEIGAGGQRKIASVRNEAGARVRSDAKAAAYGSIYKEWAKRTRRSVDDEEGEGGGGGRGGGKDATVSFDDEGGADGGGEVGEDGGARPGANRKRARTDEAGGGRPVKHDSLKTAAQIQMERDRKNRSKGNFGSKGKGGKGASSGGPSVNHLGKIRRGSGKAPSRSKVVRRGGGGKGGKGGGARGF